MTRPVSSQRSDAPFALLSDASEKTCATPFVSMLGDGAPWSDSAETKPFLSALRGSRCQAAKTSTRQLSRAPACASGVPAFRALRRLRGIRSHVVSAADESPASEIGLERSR